MSFASLPHLRISPMNKEGAEELKPPPPEPMNGEDIAATEVMCVLAVQMGYLKLDRIYRWDGKPHAILKAWWRGTWINVLDLIEEEVRPSNTT
jgi:hypothetical protein